MKKLILLLSLTASAFGQVGIGYNGNATTTAGNVPSGASAPVLTVPNAMVTICAYSPSGPCSPNVTLYSDPALTVPMSNPIQADGKGRYGFWAAPGLYSQSIMSAGGNFLGILPLTLTSPPGPQGPGGTGCGIAQCLTSTPAGGQSILQPAGTTFSANSTNGVFNEELSVGATVANRVNAATSACGSNPCYIVIPPYAPAGLGWTVPPVNVSIEDQRFFNGNGGFGNSVPDFHYFHQYLMTSAANQSWELIPGTINSGPWIFDCEIMAIDGGFPHDGIHSNTGCETISTSRTSGSRPTWGININSQYSNFNNVVDGLEIDLVNNNSIDDPGDGTAGIAINLVGSTATHVKSGVAILIGNVPSQSGSGFITAIGANAYRDYGLNLASSLTKVADIGISVPDSDPTKPSIYITSSSISAAQFAVFDDGSVHVNNIVGRGSASWGVTGTLIGDSASVAQVGLVTINQVACIKATNPRTIGYCTGVVSGTSSCTCN